MKNAILILGILSLMGCTLKHPSHCVKFCRNAGYEFQVQVPNACFCAKTDPMSEAYESEADDEYTTR